VARSAVNAPVYLFVGQLRAEYTKLLHHPDPSVARKALIRLSFLGQNNYPRPARKTPENSPEAPE